MRRIQPLFQFNGEVVRPTRCVRVSYEASAEATTLGVGGQLFRRSSADFCLRNTYAKLLAKPTRAHSYERTEERKQKKHCVHRHRFSIVSSSLASWTFVGMESAILQAQPARYRFARTVPIGINVT